MFHRNGGGSILLLLCVWQSFLLGSTRARTRQDSQKDACNKEEEACNKGVTMYALMAHPAPSFCRLALLRTHEQVDAIRRLVHTAPAHSDAHGAYFVGVYKDRALQSQQAQEHRQACEITTAMETDDTPSVTVCNPNAPFSKQKICLNHGTCIQGQDEFGLERFVCDCSEAKKSWERFVGPMCEFLIEPYTHYCRDPYYYYYDRSLESDDFCVNGGTCSNSTERESQPCDCPPGTGGKHCEFPESLPCDLDCGPNGTCRNGKKPNTGPDAVLPEFPLSKNYMYCECKAGYAGEMCEYAYVSCRRTEADCDNIFDHCLGTLPPTMAPRSRVPSTLTPTLACEEECRFCHDNGDCKGKCEDCILSTSGPTSYPTITPTVPRNDFEECFNLYHNCQMDPAISGKEHFCFHNGVCQAVGSEFSCLCDLEGTPGKLHGLNRSIVH